MFFKPLVPVSESLVRNLKARCHDLPVTAGAAPGAGPGEESQQRPRISDSVAKIKMVAGGIIEIDCPFDQTKTEQAGIEIQVTLGISRDRGNMMDSPEFQKGIDACFCGESEPIRNG